MGPVGAWAHSAAADARANKKSKVRFRVSFLFAFLVMGAASVSVYPIRRSGEVRRCRKSQQFLEWRFALLEKPTMSVGHVKLKPQHAPKAPHQDPQFLESTAARPIRILAEYLHPLVQLKNEGIGDTIVML